MNPPDAKPSHGFDDAIFPLFYALRSLGFETEILFNRCNLSSKNIIFGSCIAPRRIGRVLPQGSIIFNLEQIIDGSKWCNPDYMAHLRDYAVWDYSARNVEALKKAGLRDVTHVPLGYVPEMRRLKSDFPKGTDVLFYGLLNERRHALLQALLARGVNVLATQEAFGDLRDKLLAHARLVVNIHQFIPARLETVRLGYIWANGIPVISERRADTDIPEYLDDACVYVETADLPEAVHEALTDYSGLRAQGVRGFEAYSSSLMSENLQKVVGRRQFISGCKSIPGRKAAYYIGEAHEWLITGDIQ